MMPLVLEHDAQVGQVDGGDEILRDDVGCRQLIEIKTSEQNAGNLKVFGHLRDKDLPTADLDDELDNHI